MRGENKTLLIDRDVSLAYAQQSLGRAVISAVAPFNLDVRLRHHHQSTSPPLLWMRNVSFYQ